MDGVRVCFAGINVHGASATSAGGFVLGMVDEPAGSRLLVG